jgi:O-antigen ligase
VASHRQLPKLVLPLFLAPLFGLAIFVVATSNQKTLARYQTLQNPLTTDSLRDRLDNLWLDAGQEIARSPILGHGPFKAYFTGIITDSEFLDVLKEFGVFGFLFYLAYFLFPLFLVWRGMRAGQRAGRGLEERIPATFLTMRLSFVIIITALAMNVGMSTFYNAILQGFLFLWMGLGVRAAKTIGSFSSGNALTVQVPR